MQRMETAMDPRDRVSFTQDNPLFEMSLSRTDLYTFEPDGELTEGENTHVLQSRGRIRSFYLGSLSSSSTG